MQYNYPYHDERRMRFNTPEEMKKRFSEFPLNNDFVNWVAVQGYVIVYRRGWKEGTGSVFCNHINVSPNGKPGLADLVLMHELVHIAHSKNIDLWTGRLAEIEKFEKVIDKIAEEHLQNKDLLAYIKKKLRFEYSEN